MTISTGSSLPNPSSRPTSLSPASLQGLGVCILAGVASALVDLYLRLPLHMPGWRGLLTMGFFIAARHLSGRTWAASAAAFAACLTSLALAGPPRFTTLVFLVPGLVIDLVYALAPRFGTSVILAGLAAGLGNVAKFAVSLVAVATMARRSETTAAILPWAGHFAFGLFGGVLAALAMKPFSSNSK